MPNQPQPQRPASAPGPVEPPRAKGKTGGRDDLLALGSRLGTNILLFIVALLIAAVAWFTYTARSVPQAKLIDGSKLQAVFLNTGQVYFGNIQALNANYLVLGNVYYLQSANSTTNQQQSSNQNISLIKLGCELHKPYDEMVINTREVTFWENLQSDGQVAHAVSQFQQQNPNGQKCSDQAAPNSSTGNLQNQGSTNTNTNTSTNKKQ